MSKKANPTLIGVFVVMATAIAAAGILVLGSGRIFREATSYIVYFEGDLSGLDEGAPVTFRGVSVGEVADISIIYDHADNAISTPVTIEILPEKFVQENLEQEGVDAVVMKDHVARGLRARLASQSLVTGKLKVSLDYFPKTEVVYRNRASVLTEIPTIPALMDSLAQRIGDLPLEDIVRDLRQSTKGIAALVDSGKLQQTLDELNGALANISAVAGSKDLHNAILSIKDTLQETQLLMREVNKGVRPARREAVLAMEAFTDASRSAQYLLEYLERHPEALLRGKGNQ